jgi:hypothetical protein
MHRHRQETANQPQPVPVESRANLGRPQPEVAGRAELGRREPELAHLAEHPVGNRFLLLNRGRSLGDFAKSEISLAELTRLMAGGAELEQLAHELERTDIRVDEDDTNEVEDTV